MHAGELEIQGLRRQSPPSMRNGSEATVVPMPTKDLALAPSSGKHLNDGSGPGMWQPSSRRVRNSFSMLRLLQLERISTQKPAAIRPRFSSLASTCSLVSRKSWLPDTSCTTSMTQAGAMNFSGAMVSVAFSAKS